ncbi:MAG: Peroxiredoxin Bcp [Candidatus Moanabacter tarae]|uniref:thioredoxin-dependent peroxiredoxin n=1 Tax=Candidatus Moanibacter tarae TaxID=2200854 RepID=A0A2Z4AGN4_9BACT|nr:MAG: Peroxiredoxin Bcp [Candidatus Moanabacter tarae]|tara:strand:- start:22224 stop:22688 length:465 start_codon:yes stop_codon:yes gene_type:complete
MSKLKVGNPAPEFKLQDQKGKIVRLSDFIGRKVLVFFYPKADTPGCTVQSCNVSESLGKLSELAAVPIGISPDSPEDQLKFDEKFSLGFSLLADSNHAVAEAYGVWGEKVMYGKSYLGIIRSSFIIDEKGIVFSVWYNVSPKDTVPKALAALRG